MADQIKIAEVLSDGVLIMLADGREALIAHRDMIDCAENTGAFTRLKEGMDTAALESGPESEEAIGQAQSHALIRLK